MVSRREWMLLVLFVLFIAAAATAPIVVDKLTKPGAEPPPPAAPPRTPCPDTVDGTPKHPTEHTDRAAPYTGDGPHLMELVTAVSGVDDVYQYYEADERGLPLEWRAHEEDALRLFVCEYAVSAEPVVESCEYLGNRWVQLAPATYRYRVIEARTSRQVKDFTLHSGEGCPASIEYPADEPPPAKILESVKFTDLEKALRPIVDP